ncbi:MAG: hydrogenase nickel incorporation protein HypB [Candidatus Pseudobacter hemicellulosilyticus]|uniref:Hydrogenase nickel incorporation protein HypB n=1 Tax=Candidatus Pseudobacter hemicellulosilyticus TaxID=3121375 RepID=A0AAJ5WWB7_9BACT|nr:MAG: hydrogenase nickel incorporation protein HypB [Pseudobacter sp.]
MCSTCGCDGDGHVISHLGQQDQAGGQLHSHTHGHGHHDHTHSLAKSHEHHPGSRVVQVEKDVLYENNLLAERNRGYFEAKEILAINLVSSPGSGKTTLLERTLTDLQGDADFFVIEGDQQTTLDADRIHATGAKVVQINTNKGCHLDAHMVMHAMQGLKLSNNAVLFIENVGNLVCPAMFDLGEQERVVIMSVTEGDDKPLKYPDMFHSSSLCIINKTDLLPYVPFDIEKAAANAKRVNPSLEIIEVSCTTGEGLSQWYEWLQSK